MIHHNYTSLCLGALDLRYAPRVLTFHVVRNTDRKVLPKRSFGLLRIICTCPFRIINNQS